MALAPYRGSRAVLPFDDIAADRYADVLVARADAGAPISTADAQIAAICLAHSTYAGNFDSQRGVDADRATLGKLRSLASLAANKSTHNRIEDVAMDSQRIGTELEPVLAACGLELEAIEVHAAGNRSILRILVDGDGADGRGPGVDEIADATHLISEALDESSATGAAPYTLEVSSRGVSRPLVKPQHWRRNRDRLVKVQLSDDTEVTGRIGESDDQQVQLEVAGESRTIEFSQVNKALVQIEFNRKES